METNFNGKFLNIDTLFLKAQIRSSYLFPCFMIDSHWPFISDRSKNIVDHYKKLKIICRYFRLYNYLCAELFSVVRF